MIKTVCINCGSSPGKLPIYKQIAKELGQFLAASQINIVFGGANTGLMGEIANSALKCNGRVIGVITEYINQKVGHKTLTELIIVKDMHERKKKMFELSDAFIALPGGFGTLEEIFEIITWAQLGNHSKPFGFLNINNFYDKLIEFIDNAVEESFIKQIHKNMIIVEDNYCNLFEKLLTNEIPKVDKWQN